MSNNDKLCEVPINTFEDVLLARKKARDIMDKYGFPVLEQTKFITAISELVRNVIIHAKDGKMVILSLSSGTKKGIKCIVSDKGPGIKNLNQALTEGFSTVGSLGLGLVGAQKLSDDFNIKSQVSIGTEVIIIKWL
ncbi:MAG: anti-sigma regulatory factor [Leptospiraceae bacterium]|nr:anti-sigma regulatory factor [Leptospiraceae bacterium]